MTNPAVLNKLSRVNPIRFAAFWTTPRGNLAIARVAFRSDTFLGFTLAGLASIEPARRPMTLI
jgi:hypothetical protein